MRASVSTKEETIRDEERGRRKLEQSELGREGEKNERKGEEKEEGGGAELELALLFTRKRASPELHGSLSKAQEVATHSKTSLEA